MSSKRKYTQLSNEELKTILDRHFKDQHWRQGYKIVRLDTTHQGGASVHWVHEFYYVESEE